VVEIPWILGLAACIGVSLVSFLTSLWLARKLHLTQLELQKNAQQVHTLVLGTQGMGRRILALEEKIQQLQQRQEDSMDSDVSVYQQAKQLFAKGADASTVASNCGLSNSEAKLMALVQNQLKSKFPEPHL
jgi:hypothetical protein